MIENIALSTDVSFFVNIIRFTLAIAVGVGSYYYFKKRFLKR